MSKKYNDIMEYIEVTPEMHQRILSNIQNINSNKKATFKVICSPRIKKYLSAAACLVLIMIGALAIPMLTEQTPPLELEQGGIVEVATVEELNRMVGFEVDNLENLPFEVKKITYTSYWQSMAQISYSSDTQTAVYRKGIGSDDVSGDFNIYVAETKIKVENRTVLLKGDEAGYTLATWTDGDYSYALSLSTAMWEDAWQAVLKANA